jgi:HSP20 family protein
MARKRSYPKTAKKQSAITPNTIIPSWPTIDKAFDNFRKDFEQMFQSMPTFEPTSIPKMSHTVCDLEDEGHRFVVKVDLPGVTKKDINLNITENAIEISAEHKQETKEKKKNYLKRERNQVSYYRTLSLPEKVATDRVKAKLKDGTLDISLPKSKPTPKPKKRSIMIQ